MKYKMFSRLSALFLAGAMTLGLAACGGGTGGSTSTGGATSQESDELLGASSATIRLKVGTTTAPDGHYVLGLIEMQRLLEEYSGGEMTLDIYPNSALGNESDMMNSVSMGMQEMCLVSTGPIPAFATATANWSVLDLPYLFEDAEQAYEVLDGEVGQTLLAGFAGTGIKALGFWENGFRQVTNNSREIVSPSDPHPGEPDPYGYVYRAGRGPQRHGVGRDFLRPAAGHCGRPGEPLGHHLHRPCPRGSEILLHY